MYFILTCYGDFNFPKFSFAQVLLFLFLKDKNLFSSHSGTICPHPHNQIFERYTLDTAIQNGREPFHHPTMDSYTSQLTLTKIDLEARC